MKAKVFFKLFRDEKGRFIKGSIPWNKGLKGYHLKPPNCKCKQCGKEFRLKPYAIKRGRGIFCSKQCQAKWFSENRRGEAHPFYGRHHTRKSIEKNRQKHLGRNNPNYGKPKPPEVKRKIKESNLVAWQKPETWRNWLKGTRRRPTTLEKHLMKIIDENALPLKYVGDGRLNIGSMCPDFIHSNGLKKVVEVFSDYWHNLPGKPTEMERIRAFRDYGYDCLIIWEHEMNNKAHIISKLEDFLYGASK
jgi:hypothetical protein